MRITKIGILWLAALATLTAGVYGAISFQTIPAQTIPQTVVLPCTSAISTTSSLMAGGGALQFTCGGAAAFTTIAGSSTPSAGTANPPGPYPNCPSTAPCYVVFGYVPHGDTTSCAATTGAAFHAITTPNTATFLAQTFTAGSWDYCGIYNAPPAGGTLPGFSIGWID